MGLFRKLFKKKKNEIHLSAEEAFAVAENQAVPEEQAEDTAPESKPAITEKSETRAIELSLSEREARKVSLFFSAGRIEDASSLLRSALRSCARAISENNRRFEATLNDMSVVLLSCAAVSMPSALPDALSAALDKAPSNVHNLLLALNQALDIVPLCKGTDFDGSFQSFLDALKSQLVCYELVGSDRLVSSAGKLLLDKEGNTDFDEPAQAKTDPPVPSNDESAAEVKLPDDHAEEKAEEPVPEKPKGRAERSRELIVSHGIDLDCSHAVEIEEGHVFPRSIKETAERVSALTATALIARAYLSRSSASPASWSAALINRYETLYSVKRSFTPKETAYLRDPGAGRHASNALKAEAAAALMWALGFIDLPWPDKEADIEKLGDILKANNMNLLCTKAKPRDREELLDMYDLTTRLHALCVRAGLKELKDTGLDPDIIYERHYAFNWLLGIGGFVSWDSIIPAT